MAKVGLMNEWSENLWLQPEYKIPSASYYLNPNNPRNELPTSLSLPKEFNSKKKRASRRVCSISAPSISAFCFSRAALAADDSLETPAAACCACVIHIYVKKLQQRSYWVPWVLLQGVFKIRKCFYDIPSLFIYSWERIKIKTYGL